jgi:hypothetical protein
MAKNGHRQDGCGAVAAFFAQKSRVYVAFCPQNVQMAGTLAAHGTIFRADPPVFFGPAIA